MFGLLLPSVAGEAVEKKKQKVAAIQTG